MYNFLDFNPWWDKTNVKLKEEKFAKRFIFSKIFAVLDKQFIISISGLRRLGKTTILKQLIAEKLKQKHEARKIFFYQFSKSNNRLDVVLEYYFKTTLNEALREIKCYIFLDELQYVENWQDILKHYYDINPEIHFVVTGSASLFLKKEKKESLAGRILDFKISPLNFSEYLYIKQSFKTTKFPDLTEDSLFKKLKQRQSDLTVHQDKFFSYLVFGEFPQIVFENNGSLIKQYLNESLLDKFFNQDIMLFDIQKHEEIKILYSILMQNSAQFLNKSNISREIGLSKPIVGKYLEVLKKSFLIDYSNSFTRSLRVQEKSYKKVYSTSINLLSAMLNVSDYKTLLFPDFLGHVIETYIYNSLKSDYKNQIYFFHKNKKEVDLVLNVADKVLPIEVKTKKVLIKNDFKHLLYFMENKKIDKAIVVYGGELKKEIIKEKEFLLLPFWLF